MILAEDYIPVLKHGGKIVLSNLAGGGILTFGNVWWVDGDNGDDTSSGDQVGRAKKTIQAAVTAASGNDVVLVKPKNIVATATDPASYAESIIIPAGKSGLTLMGITPNRTQGGLPQIKPATTTSYCLTVRSAGCTIANLGINGVNSTGGGILLDDDSGTSKNAFGTTVFNCHLKNCRGTSATDGTLGGAINIKNAWQIRISGNRFLLNLSDVIQTPTAVDAKDVVIDNNYFGGPAASVDYNIYMVGTSADATGLIINNNTFQGLPAKGAGSRFITATGYTGVLANNSFASNDATFKAAGTGGLIPTTMFMAGNFQESTDAVGTFGSLTGRSS